jgi:hypothetical protein
MQVRNALSVSTPFQQSSIKLNFDAQLLSCRQRRQTDHKIQVSCPCAHEGGPENGDIAPLIFNRGRKCKCSQFHANCAVTAVTLRTEGQVDALEKRKIPDRCLEPNHISLAVQPVANRCPSVNRQRWPLLAGWNSGTACPTEVPAVKLQLDTRRTYSETLRCVRSNTWQ